jgi:pSer/pThr/pTyr-binding forkhead associated (FHA) protein/tetratricopeptide (TPR) repeat protein
MLKLSIQDSEGRSTIVPLTDGELSIGRDEANSICLTDRNVSRQHARLTTKGGHVWVENVAATYGTRFNSLLLKERVELKKGDLVQVGDYSLELVGEDGAPVKRDTALVDESSKAAPPAPASASKAKGVDGATAIVNLADIASMLKDQPAGESKNIPEGQQPRLVVESENMRGLELRITKTPIVVGRVRDNADLVIDHRSISKEHARLTRMADGNWQVLDLGSANGLKVNGEPYSKCDIRSGDRVELGHVTLRFLTAGAKAPAVTDAPAGQASGGGSKMPLMIAGAVGVVVIGAAVAFFALKGGDKDKTVDPVGVVKAGGTGEVKKDPDEDRPTKDKPGTDKPGTEKPEEKPAVAEKIDAAEAIRQADKLYKAQMLTEALDLLKKAGKDNPGNPQLELKTKQIEREADAKALLDDAQGMLENNPKEALAKAMEAKGKLRDDSALNEGVNKVIAAAKAALADTAKPKQVVAPPVQKTPPVPHEKVVHEQVKAPEKPPEVKKPPEKPAEPPPQEAKKTGKDLYDDGRAAMLQGETDKAIVAFKAAAKGGYGKAYGQLARIYYQKGDKGGCASAAKSYLDKYPDAGDAPQIQNMLEKCSN